jgi:hypothetical protein
MLPTRENRREAGFLPRVPLQYVAAAAAEVLAEGIQNRGLRSVSVNAIPHKDRDFRQYEVSVHELGHLHCCRPTRRATLTGLQPTLGSAIAAMTPLKQEIDEAETAAVQVLIGRWLGYTFNAARILSFGAEGSILSHRQLYRMCRDAQNLYHYQEMAELLARSIWEKAWLLRRAAPGSTVGA